MANLTANRQLYDLLVSKDLDPMTLDMAGKPAEDPSEAKIFKFDFSTKYGNDYGSVVIMFNNENSMEVYYGDNIGGGMEKLDKDQWFDFLYQLRTLARRNLLDFGIKDLNKLKYSLKGQAALNEAWSGTKDTSFNGKPESVRLMIKHSKPISMGEQRFRHISKLFVETSDGERFLLPFKRLSGGRAMVQHITNGGKPYDVAGQHICGIVKELNYLSHVRRKNRNVIETDENSKFNDDVANYYTHLNSTLRSLGNRNGYAKYFETWNPSEVLGGDVLMSDIDETYKEEIDSTPLDIVENSEAKHMKETRIFESWTRNLCEGTWALPDTPEKQAELVDLLSRDLPCGPDGTNATEQLYELFGDDELFDQIESLSTVDPDADARPLVIDRLQALIENPDVEEVLDQINVEASTPLEPSDPGKGIESFDDTEEVIKVQDRAGVRESRGNSGTLKINLKQMDRWKVDQDNVKFYDNIMKSKGRVETLDVRPYEELLNDFNIFYTSTPLSEGYKIVPNIDRERYTDLSHEGLEGPFRDNNGKIVYYDPREGKYYDRDSDMYLNYDEVDMSESCGINEKSVSQSQARMMAGAAHDPKFAKKVGVKQSVAKEFNKADKGASMKNLPQHVSEAGLNPVPGDWQVFDTKTREVHSTYPSYRKAMNAAKKLNQNHPGYEQLGGTTRDKFGARSAGVNEGHHALSEDYSKWVDKEGHLTGQSSSVFNKFSREHNLSSEEHNKLAKEIFPHPADHKYLLRREELDELSPQTLKKYYSKSVDDLGKHNYAALERGSMGKPEVAKQHQAKADKRLMGLDRASKRLAIESSDYEYSQSLASILKKAGIDAKERPTPDYEDCILEDDWTFDPELNSKYGSSGHDYGDDEDYYGGIDRQEELDNELDEGNNSSPFDQIENLKSKSNKELEDLVKFWQRSLSKNPDHKVAKDQLQLIKKIRAERIGRLDELSPDTLKSYVKKAGRDQVRQGAKWADNLKTDNWQAGVDATRKMNNHVRGIDRAVDRLGEDVEGTIPEFISYVLSKTRDQFDDYAEVEDLFDYAYLDDVGLENLASETEREDSKAMKVMKPRMSWLLQNINDKSKLKIIKPLAIEWMKLVAPAIDKDVAASKAWDAAEGISNMFGGSASDLTKGLRIREEEVSEGFGEVPADLSKIDTKTLQSIYSLHRHYGQGNERSNKAAWRGFEELQRRGVNVPPPAGNKNADSSPESTYESDDSLLDRLRKLSTTR